MRLAAACLAASLLATAEGGPIPNEMGVGLFPYEPIYFAFDPGIGDEPLNAKFQVSLAIRLFDPKPEAKERDGLYVAYSQTSFWDLQSDSKPFYDSSYRPEGWYHIGIPDQGKATGLGLQPGFGHESNGKSGVDSRSINHLFVRAVGQWQAEDMAIFATPRARWYTEKEDNDDIAYYRGYFDISGGMRIKDGFGLSATGRIGSGADKGSLQLEATYPIGALTRGRMSGFIYLQWFGGWSESLIGYDEKTDQPRFLLGYSIVR